MATKKTTKKEVLFLAKWNRRNADKIEKVGVKCKKVDGKYIALDGTPIPEWAEISKL